MARAWSASRKDSEVAADLERAEPGDRAGQIVSVGSRPTKPPYVGLKLMQPSPIAPAVRSLRPSVRVGMVSSGVAPVRPGRAAGGRS